MCKDKALYPPLANKYHNADSEQRVSSRWVEKDIFKKSISEREGCPDWVFYEGPPTANGHPGVHHVMARLTKDIMCRYKTMTGHRVIRKAGWDTHGLPVERSVEKKLGIQGRTAIEEHGLEPFNHECRKSVWSCKGEWDQFTERLGYWVDLDDPYITYDSNYIETVWWILSQFNEKGLLYKGHKVVPYCPTCGTPLSTNEISSGYRKVSEPSIYVKLKVKDDDAHFVTWTTTPWTLPSNVALAIGEDFDYVKVRFGDEILILAEARLEALGYEEEPEILEKFKGRDLIGRRYEPLYNFCDTGDKDGYRIVGADFVTLESGSGIVHMAPAFGEDDYQVGKANDLPFLCPVAGDGTFTEEVEPWAGMHVKDADRGIIRDLDSRNLMIREESYTHDYPFHDRCDSPLIYYATPSWFIRTSSMRDDLIKANEDITWAPPEVGSNRFGNWLAGGVDWSLSRNRFWGTPLNVWICEDCGEIKVPESRAELSTLTGDDLSELDLHRPMVDDITFACKCGKTMHRTPEVIDCWFDSGSMPFAQYHYPFENKELFESQYPADFISEGIDQTRGWFYTMLVISTFLTGKSSYKRCLTIELILDKKGKKMSKSLGNAVDPMGILESDGADPLRWYMLTVSPVWQPTRFDINGVKEAQRKLLATLENSYNFFALYANLDNWTPDSGEAELTILDRWIISRLNTVIAEVRENNEVMNFTRAGKILSKFILDDLSNWYVRLSRRRFWKGEMNSDKQAAYGTLYRVLDESLRMLAPYIPFTTEEIYLSLHNDVESVHLELFPESDSTLIDTELESIMAAAQSVVTLGRSLRQDSGIRTRQPLGKLLLHSEDNRAEALCNDTNYSETLASELNIKSIELIDDPRKVVVLEGKANFRALGPRFGKAAKQAASAITAMTPADIMTLRTNGTVSLDVASEATDFTFEEIQVVENGIDPYVAGSESGITVAMDCTLTDDLKEEGLAREIINRIQNLRKSNGLEVSDRILLSIDGSQQVQTAVSKWSDYIASETLAEFGNDEFEISDTFPVDDVEVRIALQRR